MVNDDVLVKFAWGHGYKTEWPDKVKQIKQRMEDMKLGFPGINNNAITLISFDKLVPGDFFIYDPYFEHQPSNGVYNEPPIMYQILENGKAQIEGIGIGLDMDDMFRTKRRYRDIVDMPVLDSSTPVFRVDSRPTMNGGPSYYYFFKAYRDNRI